MYQIRVSSSFSAAHNLREDNGKCENLHGHSWKVELCIEDNELDGSGFLYDFRAVKKALREQLERYDHSYINELVPFDSINPTAENLAFYIFTELKKDFPKLKEVTVWESDDARATYIGE